MPDGTADGPELPAAREYSAARIVMLSGARGDDIGAHPGEARADLYRPARLRPLDLVRPVDLIDGFA
jgi:hypothetical protein